jgi:hypothetical protein
MSLDVISSKILVLDFVILTGCLQEIEHRIPYHCMRYVYICVILKSLSSAVASTVRYKTYQAPAIMNNFTQCFINNF